MRVLKHKSVAVSQLNSIQELKCLEFFNVVLFFHDLMGAKRLCVHEVRAMHECVNTNDGHAVL